MEGISSAKEKVLRILSGLHVCRTDGDHHQKIQTKSNQNDNVSRTQKAFLPSNTAGYALIL